jgi:hypothetical protein
LKRISHYGSGGKKANDRDKQGTEIVPSCNSMEQSSFKEVIITQMVNKFPARYFTPKFVTLQYPATRSYSEPV